MNNYTLRLDDKEVYKFKTPTGRHEVTYAQWNSVFEYLKAKDKLEDADEVTTIRVGLESMCRIIAGLSQGVTYEDLLKVDAQKITIIYISDFSWLSDELPKTKFTVNGKKIVVPNFSKGTAGDYMDAMDLLNQIKDNSNDAEVGLLIAAIYTRDGEYIQDIEAIEKRKEWLRDHARMDLFFSVGFFLLSFLMKIRNDIPLHTELLRELEKLTSTCNDLDIMRYLHQLQKVEY